ncbi:hypothetical protein CSUI_006315, partial [Cystoisospora suis]
MDMTMMKEEEKEKEDSISSSAGSLSSSPSAFGKNGESEDILKETGVSPSSCVGVKSSTMVKRFEVKEAFLSHTREDENVGGREEDEGENEEDEEKSCFSSSSSAAVSLLKAFPEKSSLVSPSRGSSGSHLLNSASSKPSLENHHRRREARDKGEAFGNRPSLEDRFVRSDNLF